MKHLLKNFYSLVFSNPIIKKLLIFMRSSHIQKFDKLLSSVIFEFRICNIDTSFIFRTSGIS